jgi:hypothetical protein
MDSNIFINKNNIPDNNNLTTALGSTFKMWETIRIFTLEKYPAALQEWYCPGPEKGWNFRMKDKKRAIIYLLPRDGYFRAALVFGQKAYDEIMKSKIAKEIKKELQEAKVYAEGRGIRIDIKDESFLADLKKLVEIKLAN